MSTIGIEALVKWALLMKVPEGAPGASLGGSAWAGFEALASLGTLVDRGSGAGGASRDDGDMDPDAERIAAAVAALDDDFVVGGVDDFDPMADWPSFGAAGAAALERAWSLVVYEETVGAGSPVLRLRSPLAAQVRRVAILGRWPEWRGAAPACTVVKHQGKPAWYRRLRREVRWDADGRPIGFDEVEVDGYDVRAHRPYPGAYRKWTLAPDPSGLIASRIEYALCHAALSALASRLDGLGGRHVLPPLIDPAPWAARA